MNSTIVYHSADPESLQSSYIEYNNVDFVLNVGEGRSLVQNSVRILGDVLITTEILVGFILTIESESTQL